MKTMRACFLGASMIASMALAGKASAQEATAQISVDPQARLSTDRIGLEVSGTYTCFSPSPPECIIAFGSVFVRQASGRSVATGSGSFTASSCDGDEQIYSITALAEEIPWHGGQARAAADIFVSDTCLQEFPFSRVEQTINIKGGGK